MGRLIDADVLKIRLYNNKETVINNALVKCIDETPTAYDVETVIAELGSASYQTESTFDEDGYCNDDSEDVVELDTASEIVRNGGKE